MPFVRPNDMLIAAHALSLGLVLVTDNVREFEIVADSDRREREAERPARPARVSPQGGATAPPPPDPAALPSRRVELPSRRSGSPRSAEPESSSTTQRFSAVS